MEKLQLSNLLLVLIISLTSCVDESTEQDQDYVVTENSITTVSDFPSLNTFTGLSTDYDEYYSGYWKGSLCGGNEAAVIGIKGDTVELNTNAYFMNPVFGSIDSLGSLTFEPREVNWDPEIYGDVRPLEITGDIDRELKTGYIHFEVACSRGSLKYTISTITIFLKSGPSQPSPHNELLRIKRDAIDLIGSSVQSCVEQDQCKVFNIDSSDDSCNYSSIAYSTAVTNENKLFVLKAEYSTNKWLSTSYTSSSTTTFCSYYLSATCEESICVMR